MIKNLLFSGIENDKKKQSFPANKNNAGIPFGRRKIIAISDEKSKEKQP